MNEHTVKFAYRPRQQVRIVAYGLNCMGTVLTCHWQPRDGKLYEVEYALNSGIKVRTFYAEELEAV